MLAAIHRPFKVGWLAAYDFANSMPIYFPLSFMLARLQQPESVSLTSADACKLLI